MMKQITITWTTEDVKYIAKNRFDGVDLSDQQAWKILEKVEKYHDANEGINWDVFEIHIYEFLRQQKQTRL